MPEPKPYASPEFNPYEAPLAEVFEVGRKGGAGPWRDGTLLVADSGTELPDRCVKCDGPAEGWKLKRSLTWHPSAYYILIVISILIYAIVALVVQKKAVLYVGLCPDHRSKRRAALLVGWLASLSGVAAFIVGLTDQRLTLLIGVGVLVFVIGLIYGIVGSRVITPNRIDDRFAWIKGVHPDFLGHLPDWTT